MGESAEFLATLNHDNPDRPRFAIQGGIYPMVEVAFVGRRMSMPMAEILSFAKRWEADWDLRVMANQGKRQLSIYPYPLTATRNTDPDVSSLKWWAQEIGDGDQLV